MTDTPTMSRAEAICACTNIIDAVEALDEILPEAYSKSVHEKMVSMRDYIRSTPQYPNVTAKMDASIRNTWAGLQKWNRKGVANKELFYGLSDVIDSLNGVPEAVENEPCSEPNESDLPPVEGLEDESFSQAMLAGMLKTPVVREVAKQRNIPITTVTLGNAASTPQPPPMNDLPPTRAWTQERVIKARENVIAMVLQRFHDKAIRVISADKIKHGDLNPILKMSASDRTQQLIESAWMAGFISGAKATAEELEELLKKEK